MVVFGAGPDGRRDPVVIDAVTAEILTLSDGTRTVRGLVERLTRAGHATDAADHIAWIEHLFASGLIGLREPDDAVRRARRA
jgi:hypothetical protein